MSFQLRTLTVHKPLNLQPPGVALGPNRKKTYYVLTSDPHSFVFWLWLGLSFISGVDKLPNKCTRAREKLLKITLMGKD